MNNQKLRPFVEKGLGLIRSSVTTAAEHQHVERCMAEKWDDESEEQLCWGDLHFLSSWLEGLDDAVEDGTLTDQDVSEIKGWVRDVQGDWRDCFAGDGW